MQLGWGLTEKVGVAFATETRGMKKSTISSTIKPHTSSKLLLFPYPLKYIIFCSWNKIKPSYKQTVNWLCLIEHILKCNG